MRYRPWIFFLVSLCFLMVLAHCSTQSQSCEHSEECGPNMLCIQGKCQGSNPKEYEEELTHPKEPHPKESFLAEPILPEKTAVEDVLLDEAGDASVRERLFLSDASGDLDIVEHDAGVVERDGQPTEPELPCDLYFKVQEINFRTVLTGVFHEIDVAVFNRGGPCWIRDIKATTKTPNHQDAFQVITSLPRPFQLNANGDFLLTLRFQPLLPLNGQWEGELVIESDAVHQTTLRLPLKGATIQLDLEYLPRQLGFSSVQLGCKAEKELRLFAPKYIDPKADIKIVKISLAPGSSSAFKVNNSLALPQALSPTSSASIKVAYQPVSVGLDKGSLEIFINSDAEPLLRIPLSGEGRQVDDYQEVFQQYAKPKVDILFVVNVSYSGMMDAQNYLKQNISTFLDRGLRYQADFHLGVIPSSLESSSSRVLGCLLGTIKNVTSNTLQPDQVFAKNIPVTTSYSYPTAGLDASYLALTRPLNINPSCNQGFLRDDAMLSIIQVSKSSDTYGDQQPRSLAFFKDFYTSLKGRQFRDLFRFSTWSGPPPSGCYSGNMIASESPRYWTLATEFQGAAQPICKFEPSVFDELSAVTFRYREHFALEHTPKAGTLSVEINGQTQSSGWLYKSSENAVQFSASTVPPSGSSVRVRYKAVCVP